MGLSFSGVWNHFSGNNTRVLLIGLDSVGKATILYQFNREDSTKTSSAIGLNEERAKYQNISFAVWDLPVQERIRPLLNSYLENVRGIIFVVDSADRQRIKQAAAELKNILSEPILANAILVIFANKQDLPGCMSVDEVTEEMELNSIAGKKWFVIGTNGRNGEGIFEGLNWIAQKINEG